MDTDKKRTVLQDRLALLTKNWGWQSAKIHRLNGEAAGMGALAGMDATLLQKLTKLLGQIAFFRHKEEDIISEINDVEKHHRFLRQHKKLKKADPSAKFNPISCDEEAPEPPKSNFWLWAAWFWLMAKDQKTIQKQRHNYD